jgi:hypothetical protein
MNDVTGGGRLDWGIKESFRSYLEMVPDASIEASNGAIVTAAGTFSFPLEKATATDGRTVLDFGGTVTVTAHDGELSVLVSRPQVVLREADGVLRMREGELDVAVLRDVERFAGVVTAGCQLSAVGESWLLPGYYQAGELLDPITVVLRGG